MTTTTLQVPAGGTIRIEIVTSPALAAPDGTRPEPIGATVAGRLEDNVLTDSAELAIIDWRKRAVRAHNRLAEACIARGQAMRGGEAAFEADTVPSAKAQADALSDVQAEARDAMRALVAARNEARNDLIAAHDDLRQIELQRDALVRQLTQVRDELLRLRAAPTNPTTPTTPA